MVGGSLDVYPLPYEDHPYNERKRAWRKQADHVIKRSPIMSEKASVPADNNTPNMMGTKPNGRDSAQVNKIPALTSTATGANATGASALGALALGAFAIGALAIGALAIGRLKIGRARVRRLEIDELIVHKYRSSGTAPNNKR